jgi:hypothetical protein
LFEFNENNQTVELSGLGFQCALGDVYEDADLETER